MRGRPLLFLPWVVGLAIPDRTAGVYVLGDLVPGLRFRPRYVGRSDADLRERLKEHELRSRLAYFRFAVCRDAGQAFARECEYWHALREADLLNRIHPDAPAGSGLLCPYCATAEHFRRLQSWQIMHGSVSSSSSSTLLKI